MLRHLNNAGIRRARPGSVRRTISGRAGRGCAEVRIAHSLVTALLVCVWAAALSTAPITISALAAAEGPAILTFHGDLARTGWTVDERTLTPATVRSGAFGKLWASSVRGEIYAEPLVVPGVAVLGRVRTVVYVVTEDDLIYALDASDGKPVWGPVSLGTPVPRAALPCGNIDPVGITSTPVLDREAGTLYVVGLTTPDGGHTKTYKIAAFDLKSGVMRPGWPTAIAPPASSGLRFDPEVQQQRGALTLMRGLVYVPFGGYWGDCANYHGWVVAVRTVAPGSQEAFATPTRRMGGIWATGGISADPEGYLYAATGNSDSAAAVDLGNSVIRLSTAPALHFSGTPRDFFTPSNFVSLNESDTDLGSSAPLMLPDQPNAATPHLVFVAGKQGVGYLINRDNMGGVGKGDGVALEGMFSRCIFGTCNGDAPQVFSASAYWDGGNGRRLILVPGHGRQPAPCRARGGIVALRLGTTLRTRASTLDVVWCSRPMRDPGAPSVSGRGPDGGVVWVVDTGALAVLHALDARTGVELYGSTGADAIGRAQRFVSPAVVGGHVYIGAGSEVVAYGLR